MKALVINGPNLNMLGIREPGIYGTDSYETLVSICQDSADELGFDGIEVFQSNHEGAIVDRIQEAYGRVDGIVINPAAYTHTSIAILDALKAVGIPAVEVHISAVRSARCSGRYRMQGWPALHAYPARAWQATPTRSKSWPSN